MFDRARVVLPVVLGLVLPACSDDVGDVQADASSEDSGEGESGVSTGDAGDGDATSGDGDGSSGDGDGSSGDGDGSSGDGDGSSGDGDGSSGDGDGSSGDGDGSSGDGDGSSGDGDGSSGDGDGSSGDGDGASSGDGDGTTGDGDGTTGDGDGTTGDGDGATGDGDGTTGDGDGVCADLTGVDFGPCAQALGVGYRDGSCGTISGCGCDPWCGAIYGSETECAYTCAANGECREAGLLGWGIAQDGWGVGEYCDSVFVCSSPTLPVSTIMTLFPGVSCAQDPACGNQSMACMLNSGQVNAADMIDYCALTLWPGPTDVYCRVWGP